MNTAYRKLHKVLANTLLAALIPGLLLIGQVRAAPLSQGPRLPTAEDITPPASPVRLLFIHHSTGGLWLADGYGRLGIALSANNYYVSATNYGWTAGGQDIGNRTDLGHWYNWFGSGRNPAILTALYAETGKNLAGDGDYSRVPDAQRPPGENEIIVFKSCYPNSALGGSPSDPVPPIGSNPLRGQDAWSAYMTVANAKGIYIDLLPYFQSRTNKLFVVITAPPQSDGTYADNARAFNNWLVNDWLANYPFKNVVVFDFYNVLTTNGGNANTNDLGLETGNHHRWWNNALQHKTNGDNDASPNTLEYPTGDDHPSAAGELKATGEFVTLLNLYYHRWKNQPTAVELAAFNASPAVSRVEVTWQTVLELNVVGFNLYRSISPDSGSERQKLNAELIPARAPGDVGGASYEFTDRQAQPGIQYYYWLEVINRSDQQIFGPQSASALFGLFLPMINK